MLNDSPSAAAAPAGASLRDACRYWLELGFVSFGGPAGQIALMHEELVEKRRWISERRFLHALNYCMLLPGPEATQLAIYIGWLLHRTPGGIIAGAFFVLPSLLILIGLSWVYLAFGTVPAVAAVLYGVKPAVVAIVLAAALRIGTRSLKNRWLAGIALLAFLAIGFLQVPFPLIVLAAATAGAIGGRLLPRHFSLGGGHAIAAHAGAPALIDDDTPTPPHARFTWGRLGRVLLAGLTLGGGAWGTLALACGSGTVLPQLGWFFTKAALMTFGGAYAVLPYVYQGAVDHFHWLTAAQMIDGLALGETTPGPLIMIVAFVGFLGSSAGGTIGGSLGGNLGSSIGAIGAPATLALAGIAGACVATFFTFLPSFIFILAGGPVVESTRNDLRLTAPLTGISAAVVGVIASLAIFLARHVFQAQRPLAQWDWIAVAIALTASVALIRFRIGTIPVLFACAAAGVVVSYSPTL